MFLVKRGVFYDISSRISYEETWHTLSAGMPHVALAAVVGFENPDNCADVWTPTGMAALLRKVMPANGDFLIPQCI